MLRSALAPVLAASAVVFLLAGCADKTPPAPPPQAAFVPPPLPDPPPAPWCARPAEITAFSIAALKSTLMVAAISCSADDKYNAFVRRYKPSLMQTEKTTDGYFSRNAKSRWQQSRDDYITQLANAQSQRAIVFGNQFCQHTLGQFDEVLALGNPDQLPTYAGSKSQSIPQPMKFSECPAAPPSVAKPARSAKPTKHAAAK